MTLYEVDFVVRGCNGTGKVLDTIEMHHDCLNREFFRGLKVLAKSSKADRVEAWGNRSPCQQLSRPVCLTIKVYRVAVEKLTGLKERCGSSRNYNV